MTDNEKAQRVFQAVVYAYEGKPVPEDLLTHGMVRRALKWRALQHLTEPAADRENLIDMLCAVEWVRQASGNKYACAFCGGVSERDGGPGHAENCRWQRAVCQPVTSGAVGQRGSNPI